MKNIFNKIGIAVIDCAFTVTPWSVIMTRQMKKYLPVLSLLLIISISPLLAQNKSEITDRGISSWVEKYMGYAVKYDHFSGVVLVAHNDNIIFKKAFGMANYELQVPNTLDTKFRIGSVSKTFTSAAIMLLHQQNKLNIDSSISKYIDNCPPQWAGITIRHLLIHTSGIVNFSRLPEASGNFLLVPHTQKEVIDLFRNLPLESKPGEKYNYNNSAYYLLGVITEKVSGQSYEQYLRDNIFIPLKMKNTGFDHNETLLVNRASGYRQVNDSLFLNTICISMDNLFSIGGLYSNALDLLLWDQSYYSNKLFNKSILNEIFTPSPISHYGLGWIIDSLGNCPRSYHDGGIIDFSASLQRLVGKHITVIAISNKGSDGGIKVAYDIAGKICGHPATIRGIQDQMEKLSSDELFRLVNNAKAAFHQFRINERLVEEVAKDIEKHGKFNQAVEVYRLNTLLYPTSENAFLKLGEKYLAANNLPKAKESFKKCLQINPSNKEALKYFERD